MLLAKQIKMGDVFPVVVTQELSCSEARASEQVKEARRKTRFLWVCYSRIRKGLEVNHKLGRVTQI